MSATRFAVFVDDPLRGKAWLCQDGKLRAGLQHRGNTGPCLREYKTVGWARRSALRLQDKHGYPEVGWKVIE